MWLLFNPRKKSISWPANVISAAKTRVRVLHLTPALISLNESQHVPSLWNQMPASIVRGVHISQIKTALPCQTRLISLLSGWVCLLSHYSAKNLTLLLSKKSDIVTTTETDLDAVRSRRCSVIIKQALIQGLNVAFECLIWVYFTMIWLKWANLPSKSNQS